MCSFSAPIQNSIEDQHEYKQEQKLARKRLNVVQEEVIMKKLTTINKIEELNKYCGNSLSLLYILSWRISSFRDNSLFNIKEKLYKKNNSYLQNKSLEKLIDIAYKEMAKDKRHKELKEDRGDIGDGDTYFNNKEEPPKEAE